MKCESKRVLKKHGNAGHVPRVIFGTLERR